MRITNNMMISNLLGSLQNNQNVMSKNQQILATGKKFITPSDDPIAMTKSMMLNTDIAESDQYKKNCNDAVSWLSMTEDAITNVQSVVKRAKDLALQAANGTNTTADRQSIAEEMKQLKSELVNLANTNYAGRYMFSGFQTDQKLLNDAGTYNISVSEISSNQFGDPSTALIGKTGILNLQKEDGTTVASISYSSGDTWQSLADKINATTGTPPTAVYPGIQASLSPGTISGPNKLVITSDKTVGTLVDKGGLINNTESIEYKVGVADTIKVNTLGTEIFGAGKKGDEPKLLNDFDNYINTLIGEIGTDFYTGGVITKSGTISTFTKADGTTVTAASSINYGPVSVPPVIPATNTDVTSLANAINSDVNLKAAGITAKVVIVGQKSRLVVADSTGELKENSGLLQNSNVGIEQAVQDMDDNLNVISKSISELGAKSNRAELTSNRLDDQNANFTKLLTDNEDIDYEKIIMELTNNESVYNASLSIGMRVIQKSLVDFLG